MVAGAQGDCLGRLRRRQTSNVELHYLNHRQTGIGRATSVWCSACYFDGSAAPAQGRFTAFSRPVAGPASLFYRQTTAKECGAAEGEEESSEE